MKQQLKRDRYEPSSAQDEPSRLLVVLDSLAMYGFTVVGVVMSKYMQLIWTDAEIVIKMNIGRLLGSLAMAWVLQSGLDTLRPGATKSARIGRLKNFKRRAIHAMSVGAAGYSWFGG